MRMARLTCRRAPQRGTTAGREVVHPAPVGEPVAQQPQVAAEVAAERRRSEHVLQAARRSREPPVPVVGVADHAVPEPERRHRELDRHGRYVGRRGVGLDELAAVREDVVDEGGSARSAAGSRAGSATGSAASPSCGPAEALGRRHRGGQRVGHPVVEPDHREVGLRDDQVLVVAGVGDQRLPLRLLFGPCRPGAGRGRPSPRRADRDRSSPILRCSPSAAKNVADRGRPARRRTGSRGRAAASGPAAGRPARRLAELTSVRSMVRSWSTNWPR